MAIAKINPSLAASSRTAGSGEPTVHEIFTEINNAKDKPKKIAILKQHNNQAIQQPHNQTNTQNKTQTSKPTNTQTNKPSNKQINTQSNKHTNKTN